MMPQQYCLRWKHHHTNVQNMFAQLLEKERFCDVTLYCSPSFATQVPNKDTVDPQNIRGVSLRAHRVVLAACSELLGALLGAHEAQGEPVLVIDGAEPRHLKALLDYMYTGEMNVHHSQLASLLKTAEELRIKGLTDIRWNNKDEPPDCDTDVVTAVPTHEKKPSEKIEKQPSPKHSSPKHMSPKHSPPKQSSPKHTSESTPELRAYMKKEEGETETKPGEKFSVNGGPPPLIKLPTKEKTSSVKRDRSDSESPSPKRRRATSATELTEDDSVSHKSDRDQEWQHGNLDITAERVAAWGAGGWSRGASDDEWADAPADIGSFLHTRLRVDGDNSADEESNESGAAAAATSAPSSSSSAAASDMKVELPPQLLIKPTIGPKSGPTDPRFTDVVKLSDYLQHGRRPQFWEENYVKRVMEAVRVKELEMKQAAEILGVSYGTLYGRYRDVYGCINRPYRTARDFWQAKGPSEVLERLQRGELSLDAAALSLGVSITNLSAYMTECPPVEKDFEPIPIEIDPSLKLRARTYSGTKQPPRKSTVPEKPKKVLIGSLTDEDPIPATVITTHEGKNAFPANTATTTTSGKWPSIRVASLDSLRGSGTAAPSPAATPTAATVSVSGAPTTPATASEPHPASPSQLMRSRPDLTIVAARRPDHKKDDSGT
ncbi:uncharacterized protein ACR2FA_008334 [Aphomia sociella]